jgi:hypothetical protein
VCSGDFWLGRWATEDPNPVAKVREAKRLDELGAAGVATQLTPEFVRQVRQLDELDGIVEPLPDEHDDARDETGASDDDREPAPKRARIEAGGDVVEAQSHQPQQGLLSATALNSLKLAAKLKQQQAEKGAISADAGGGGLAGLAGYGSDED